MVKIQYQKRIKKGSHKGRGHLIKTRNGHTFDRFICILVSRSLGHERAEVTYRSRESLPFAEKTQRGNLCLIESNLNDLNHRKGEDNKWGQRKSRHSYKKRPL